MKKTGRANALYQHVVDSYRGLLQAPAEKTLHAHRLLRSHYNRRQPIIAVRLLAANDAVKLCLQRFGHWAELAFAHGNFVDRANRRDFGGGAREEHLLGDIERLPP